MEGQKQDKLFHENKEIGPIDVSGQIINPKNQEGIEPIIKALPFFLSNALPEGERYENLLLHSPHGIHSPVDALKNVDEIPGNFTINTTQQRIYTVFPSIPDKTIYAETTLSADMFFVNSEIRGQLKPSFSGYQDKFAAKAVLLNDRLTVAPLDQKKEFGNVIVKPGIKRPFIGQNEFVCMRLAQKIGLEVPRVFLIKHLDPKLPAQHCCIERFDFEDKPPFLKKNMMEFASLMALASEQKYQSTTDKLFQSAETFLNKSDLRKLGQAYFYGILIGNGDMHTKNFSVFVEKNGNYRLTPIYDMVNTQVHGFHDMLALPMQELSDSNPPMHVMLEFLGKYIGQMEMARIAKAVKVHLPGILQVVFSDEGSPNNAIGQQWKDSRLLFQTHLKESILERVSMFEKSLQYLQTLKQTSCKRRNEKELGTR